MDSPTPQSTLVASPTSIATPTSSRLSFGIPRSFSTPTPSSSSSERLFTPFRGIVSGGEGSRALGAASTELAALRDVLNAIDTLPFVKYLASVGVQLLQYVIEMQINNDMFKNLAFRAKDVIVAVARACDGLQSMAAQLESDLRQLTSTMDNILAFATEKVSRGTLKKLWSKSEDVAMVRALDMQLTHAFHIFQIQSDVISRRQQDLMMKQLADLSVSPIPSHVETITDRPLRVQEGIYLIKNAASGNVLEIEDFKPYGHVSTTHVVMVTYSDEPLQTQSWSIQRHANKDFDFTIRSLATGYVLDIVHNWDREGTKVGGHPWQPGAGNEIWSAWGTRRGASGDYCTIRSSGLSTVLDGSCPQNNPKCHELHATHITNAGPSFSQEWQLVPLSSPSSGLASVTHAPDTPDTIHVYPRRRLLLQNVQTGMFATRIEDSDGSNVTLTTSPSSSSSWSILYIDIWRLDRFAIITTSAHPQTLDHWGGSHINVSSYLPENPNHQWTVSARDGAFIFRNHFTDDLLAARSGAVDTLPLSARDSLACHWRLIDATTNEHVRIFYDSALSVVPPELAGSALDAPRPTSKALTLRTGDPSPEMRLALLNSFRREHATIRAMLQDGYKAIVYAPRTIIAWREGEVKKVEIVDVDAEYKWSWEDFEPCA